jgi:hypothetical protein
MRPWDTCISSKRNVAPQVARPVSQRHPLASGFSQALRRAGLPYVTLPEILLQADLDCQVLHSPDPVDQEFPEETIVRSRNLEDDLHS